MSARPTLHILSQYLWPDDAPTGIYAEQVADAMTRLGARVVMLGGQGEYRKGRRPQPATPIRRVPTYEGQRGRLISTAFEYESVRRAFRKYVRANVAAGDVVVVTSAPPTTLLLNRAISGAGGVGVYWLQDYYPQLIRGVWDPPGPARAALHRFWTNHLTAWPHVVKAAGNLGYSGSNAVVIRNWNTLDLGTPKPFRPNTALYAGNLGYGHHLPSFLALCERLREQGVTIVVRGDGPGIRQLPEWIRVEEPFIEPQDCVDGYWNAEVHLVAGHPDLPDAVFPSKFWNAHATGRTVLASGFSGVMARELEEARRSDFRSHVTQWCVFLQKLLDHR